VLLTLVPKNDILRAEVWVSNEDIGFVRKGQPVRIKLAAYPFQKYGMLDGERLELAPGMQASGEIHLGRRSVVEYLFWPVQKAWHEKGRER